MAIYQGLVPNVTPLAQAIIGMGERKRADDQMRMILAQNANAEAATGYGDLVPKNLRGDFQSPKVQRSVVFKDGSNLTIMNDGTRRVTSPTGDIVEGQAAVDVINAGNEAGIAYTGQESFERGFGSESGKTSAQERDDYMRQGRVAQEMIPATQKLLELNNIIKTSGFSSAKKAVSDFFGVTDADQGLFNEKAGKLILDNIRALGANPTEGERAFLEKITPSIRQGGAVNEAILKDMLEVQKRQAERARWLYNNPNSSVDDYFFMEKIEDFTPSDSYIDEPTQMGESVNASESVELTPRQRLEQLKQETGITNESTATRRNRRGR